MFRQIGYWFKKQFAGDVHMPHKEIATSVELLPLNGLCGVGVGLSDLIDRVVIGLAFLFL
jgi:hypothetical protein